MLAIRLAKNSLILGAACFLVAGCISVGLGDHSGTMPETHDDAGVAATSAMPHELYEVPAGVALPSLTLEVLKDPMVGYNVHVQTQNFRFAPEHASTAHVAGEGHAHLMVDGVKVNRMYGDWYHLSMTPGVHTVQVSLNTNDHHGYARDGKEVMAEQVVTVE